MLLTVSVVANIGMLFIFKYFNFFNENIATLAQYLHYSYTPLLLHLVLPLGLSFHIFQGLGYVIEVYKRKQEPEKSFSVYTLYVLFFPQMVAGPIERPQHFLPQLHKTINFDVNLARKGLERMLWGFFKKMAIADQIAQVINPLYLDLPKENFSLLLIAILFTYQIYCDFSGYSDIAIGAAMMLGFNLTENFNRPFAARTVADFWRRWHISLSSWVRDYLYFPLVLGSGRVSKFKMYYALLFTFLAIGLWHGANWTFIVFGLLHGVYIVVESYTEGFRKVISNLFLARYFPGVYQAVQTVIVFSFVAFTCIFFRSESVGDALFFISKMTTFEHDSTFFTLHDFTKHTGNTVFYSILLNIIIVEIAQYVMEKKKSFYIFDSLTKGLRFSWYYYIIATIILFGYFGNQSFIYFQF